MQRLWNVLPRQYPTETKEMNKSTQSFIAMPQLGTSLFSVLMMMDGSPERVEYNHHTNPQQNTDMNNSTYVLEEQFATMDIHPLAHISKPGGLQENIQVDEYDRLA